MRTHLQTFWISEDGAVTIDWVVLTAALLILGVVIGTTVSDGAKEMSDNTGDVLGAAVVPDVVF